MSGSAPTAPGWPSWPPWACVRGSRARYLCPRWLPRTSSWSGVACGAGWCCCPAPEPAPRPRRGRSRRLGAVAERRYDVPSTVERVAAEDLYGEDLTGRGERQIEYVDVDLTESRSSAGAVF